MPAHVAADTVTVPFNDKKAVTQAIRRHGKELACVLVEPVLANVGVIAPEEGFLKFLREVTVREKIHLIFDEVITGFRLTYGGAQKIYRVKPDLTILGKVIGGGFPVGAYGGSRKLMRHVAPAGPVYQAGTLAGHPVAMAAGLATLKVLRQKGIYHRLEKTGRDLAKNLLTLSRKAGIPVAVHQVGSLLTLFFTRTQVRNAADARVADSRRYARYFRGMLERGVYLPPSAYEGWFLSTTHGEQEIEATLKAHDETLQSLTGSRRFRG